MKPFLKFAISLLFLLTPAAFHGCAADNPNGMVGKDGNKGFIAKKLVRANGTTRKYGLFIPLDYNPTFKYPALIFLHGIGESGGGEGDLKQMTVGIGPTISRLKENFPFIVIFPQSEGAWDDPIYGEDAIAELAAVSKEYSVDPDRVSLTGVSVGGYGTYVIGAHYPKYFAALVPIASNGQAINLAQHLTNIPVRAFCSKAGDPFANSNDRAMVSRIKTLGGDATFEETPTEGHDSWDYVYSSGEILGWLLKQRRVPSFMYQ